MLRMKRDKKSCFQDLFIPNRPHSLLVLIFSPYCKKKQNLVKLTNFKILSTDKSSLPRCKENMREQETHPLPYGGIPELGQDTLPLHHLHYSSSGIEQGGRGRNPCTSPKMSDCATNCGFIQADVQNFCKPHFSYLVSDIATEVVYREGQGNQTTV